MYDQRCYELDFWATMALCLIIAASRLHNTLIKHCAVLKPGYQAAMFVNYKATSGAAKAVS